MFSLFGSKRELFLQAVERGFEKVTSCSPRPPRSSIRRSRCPTADALVPMANAYIEQLDANRDILLLQQHAYAACGDDEIRPRVRACHERLIAQVKELSGADDERVEEFFRYGAWINVRAALGIEDPCQQMHWRIDDPEAGTGPMK